MVPPNQVSFIAVAPPKVQIRLSSAVLKGKSLNDVTTPPSLRQAARARSRHQDHRRRDFRWHALFGHAAGDHQAARNSPQDAARLLELIVENQAVGIVLGLPLNMDGSEGPRAQSTRAFARNLAQKTPLPIAFWDERLSTAAVTRTLIEADTRRDKRRRGRRQAGGQLHPAGRWSGCAGDNR